MLARRNAAARTNDRRVNDPAMYPPPEGLGLGPGNGWPVRVAPEQPDDASGIIGQRLNRSDLAAVAWRP